MVFAALVLPVDYASNRNERGGEEERGEGDPMVSALTS